MKIVFQYITVFALCAAGMSCKKDNYKEPSSALSGRIVYKGEAIGVENYQVPYQLYQFGFGKVGSIDGSFAQDGSYSSLLFDGDYKLIIPNGQGPFKWKQLASGAPDTTTVTLRGSQTLDLEVTPYYMIRTPQVTAGSGKVAATFKAEKIITDAANAKNIERVTLYINKTQFVSGANNIASTTLAGTSIVDPNNIALSVTVPGIAPQNYVYARIGLKIAGVEDLIFSPAQKVTF
jgi:Protein of unknown function (DUF3823) N-terminal domain/Domain of unknown function (DUF3823_C)